MTRVLALLALLIATAVLSLAEEQSPRNKSAKSQSSDVDPALVRQNLSDELSAGATGAEEVARLEKKLAEAQADAKGVERLCKTGVLSKVEKELRLLKVVQCEAELANARLSEAARAATAKRERAELAAAEANVHRQQELLKLGLAAKEDVDRAEEKLTELKAQKN